jgi:urease beta subunit
MPANALRRARYAALVEGSKAPVHAVRDINGPQAATAIEADSASSRKRNRFERAVAIGCDDHAQRIAETLAFARQQSGGFRTRSAA